MLTDLLSPGLKVMEFRAGDRVELWTDSRNEGKIWSPGMVESMRRGRSCRVRGPSTSAARDEIGGRGRHRRSHVYSVLVCTDAAYCRLFVENQFDQKTKCKTFEVILDKGGRCEIQPPFDAVLRSPQLAW